MLSVFHINEDEGCCGDCYQSSSNDYGNRQCLLPEKTILSFRSLSDEFKSEYGRKYNNFYTKKHILQASTLL